MIYVYQQDSDSTITNSTKIKVRSAAKFVMVEVFSIDFQEAKALFPLRICGSVDAKFGLCYTSSQKKKKKMQAASFVSLQLRIQDFLLGGMLTY